MVRAVILHACFLATRYDTVPTLHALVCALYSYVFFCLAEGMFIRAKIVPKVLQIIIYFQWAVGGMAWVITFIWIILGGGISYVT